MESKGSKKLTLEELRAKTAKTVKEQLTFEKTPTYDMKLGEEIQFRIKKVVPGTFGAPIIVCSELRVGDKISVDKDPESTKFSAGVLKAYTQDGLTGPREYTEVAPGKDIRVPTFVVKRAQSQALKLVEDFVYLAHYRSDKKVEKGTFKLATVALAGTDFADE